MIATAIVALLLTAAAFAFLPPRAYAVLVSWDSSVDSGIVAYRVHYGRVPREYTGTIEVGAVTKARVPNLIGGARYYFAVTAVHWSGEESEYSDEISFVPGPRTIGIANGTDGTLILTVHGVPGQFFNVEASEDFKDWQVVATVRIEANGCVEFLDPDASRYPQRYYRTELVE